ncbi:MAG TPA: fasciclin domain-containing protein [Pseudoxanthomonas sp.]|nr:fasciclin domain-containing protein [Pseudoxanthomonas sp.]
MKKTLIATALLSALVAAGCAKPAADEPIAAAAPVPEAAPPAEEAAPAEAPTTSSNPMVGGAEMRADRDIVENAANSQDHTTLVAAVQAAGLVDTLKGAGPFTVFAPVNAAFDALPAGTVDGLLKPEAKGDLTKVLTYHVVPGKVDAAALAGLIDAGGGSATVTTVEGGTLNAKKEGDGVTVTDAKGNVAKVTIADVMQSNGVIHVVDKVLMP